MILNRKRESLSPRDSDIFRKMETLHDSYFRKWAPHTSGFSQRADIHHAPARGPAHSAIHTRGGLQDPGVQHSKGGKHILTRFLTVTVIPLSVM